MYRVVADGLTTILETGTKVTVTIAMADRPSLVAVMVASPGVNADTSPASLTAATVGALVVQETERPARLFPLASQVVAVNGRVWVTRRVRAAGATVMAATGGGGAALSPLHAVASIATTHGAHR